MHQSIILWWWGCNIFGITEIPQLIFITWIIPLTNNSSIIFWVLTNIKNFSIGCINNMIFLALFLINSKFLIRISLLLGTKIELGSIIRTFNSKVLIAFLAFDIVVRSILCKSELLIIACISLPYDGESLRVSVLGNVENLSCMDSCYWVVGFSVFPVLVLLSVE